jgi:hypothetical protein
MLFQMSNEAAEFVTGPTAFLLYLDLFASRLFPLLHRFFFRTVNRLADSASKKILTITCVHYGVYDQVHTSP